MKTTAWMAEDGRKVDARDDEDWALVYKTGRRLFCPSHTAESCSSELTAKQRMNKKKRTMTRFFAFAAQSRRCGHAEVGEGVEVPFSSDGESAEHLWLKEYVLTVAQKCGYAAEAEHPLESGARADVWVQGVRCGRVEVQRVPTGVMERTEQHPDVLWLLREGAMTPQMTSALFEMPCVQVRIRELDGEGAWVAANPWESDGRQQTLSVRATATTLTRRDGPQQRTIAARRSGRPRTREVVEYFKAESVRLDDFLEQVWSGKRRWFPKGDPHHFAGWILVEEYEQHQRWNDERRRAAQESERREAEERKAATLLNEVRALPQPQGAEIGKGAAELPGPRSDVPTIVPLDGGSQAPVSEHESDGLSALNEMSGGRDRWQVIPESPASEPSLEATRSTPGLAPREKPRTRWWTQVRSWFGGR